jgi:hypothetical protein
VHHLGLDAHPLSAAFAERAWRERSPKLW